MIFLRFFVFRIFSYCQFQALQHYIVKTCNCVPEFFPKVREIIGSYSIRACNFFEYSSCVSFIMSHFDPEVNNKCLPGCIDSGYSQVRIQYQTAVNSLKESTEFETIGKF